MRSITTDLLAGLLVGVVLVPTAMAYGVIAGVRPASGLYGAIVIGLLATIAGGTRGLISGPNIFVMLSLSDTIIRQAARLRQQHRMGLGDAIVAATAMVHDLTLVTHNIQDFSLDWRASIA